MLVWESSQRAVEGRQFVGYKACGGGLNGKSS